MSITLKLLTNCSAVAGLTFLGLMAFASLPQFTLKPLQWAGNHLDQAGTMTFWFVWTVLIWAVVASIIAWIMLSLKPRNIILYGLVSAATFVMTSQSWNIVLQKNTIGSFRELVLMITIPFIYWLLVQWTENGQDQTLHSNPQTGAS